MDNTIPAHNAPVPNTLRVPVRAQRFVRLKNVAALPHLLSVPEVAQGPLFVLGSGSNVLFARDFPGTVIQMATRGIEDTGTGRVRVAAGESWDGFVRWSLAAGYAGLENLILIPGTVGAAPVQNIGAYGVELAEFVTRVEVWDRKRGLFTGLPAEACAFAYRDSVFKREPGRHIILGVEFELPSLRAPRVEYQGVREALESQGIQEPTALDVARTVEQLRRDKLPDPAIIGNAGSFFKNPIVDKARLQSLREQYPALPVYPQRGGGVKLSAAWLIEQCGLKGARVGDAGLSPQHALVLVNHGEATGQELLDFARDVQTHVAGRFGIMLQPEPLIVPAEAMES